MILIILLGWTFVKLGNEDRFGHQGFGIGLATVIHLVDGLGGEINVESKVGEGTRFNFSLRK